MITTANRLKTVQEYYFSKKLREVREMVMAGKPVINMGIGSPDLHPSPEIMKALQEAMMHDMAHQYQSYQGLPALREAMAKFYEDHFQVDIDAQSEVLPLMGSKEGIMHISLAFLNPGDEVLIPNPGYPTYSSVTKLVEANPVYYHLKESTNWMPDFEALEKQDLSKTKLMWINYPHMPTGTNPTKALFEQLIAFAKKHQILLVNDNPYSFILNDKPMSILEVPGAKEVALELNSLSKTFNMAGWRVGMIYGAAQHIQSILKVKSNMDSGMFYGIQQGAIAALKSSDTWYNTINAVYQRRRELIYDIANALGCTYKKNTSGMFVWAKLPLGETNAEAFVDRILKKKNIFITPGSIFGSNGNGYIRFSLCVREARIIEALKRLK